MRPHLHAACLERTHRGAMMKLRSVCGIYKNVSKTPCVKYNTKDKFQLARTTHLPTTVDISFHC